MLKKHIDNRFSTPKGIIYDKQTLKEQEELNIDNYVAQDKITLSHKVLFLLNSVSEYFIDKFYGKKRRSKK